MEKNGGYALRYLHGVPYLLPFGQNVADLRRGVRLDEGGVFLWETMDEAATERELLERFLVYAGAGPGEAAEAGADVRRFLDTLRACGILPPQTQGPERGEPPCMTLRVGGLHIRLLGRAEYWAEEFRPFALPDGEAGEAADQTIAATEAPPPAPVGARVVLCNRELAVCEAADRWVVSYPKFSFVPQAELSRDGAAARFHVRRPASGEEAATLRFELFHAARHAFLYLAQRRGYYALHSASVLYRDRAWLFSGPSGAGKSTQAELWRASFGAPLLNGDLNLLSLRDGAGAERPGRAFVHGLPWCGTSGVSTARCVELGGVVLLRQARENRLEPLREDQKQLLVTNRLISPAWTEEQADGNLAFAEELARRVGVWRLRCTKEPSAAEFMRAEIDRYLKGATDT